MSGITTISDKLAQRLLERFGQIEEQLRTLQQPTGTSVGSLVNQVQQALINITATVNAKVVEFLSSGFSTGGNVTATGNVTAAGTVSGVAALKSAGAAGTNLGSVSGNRQTVWQIYDGANVGLYGYAPSSITTKTNLEQVPYSAESFLRCAAYLYEYKDQVAMRHDPNSEYYDPEYQIPQEVGYMAEHLIENGLKQFVTIRDEQPIGIDYAAFGAVGMNVIGRAHAAEIAAIKERLDALGV
jgi:hypothetical protein